jgi:hypothetical protein
VGRFLELIPLTFLLAGGLWEMIGITEITPVVCIVYDTIKHRHLHPAFAWGGLGLLSSLPVFMVIGGTRTWLNFMTWLLSSR